MNKIILGTHILLGKWGTWGQDMNLGLPSISPMFGERALKTPLYSRAEPDPEMSLVDTIVCQLDAEHRALIIRKYCWRWPTRQFLRAYRWTFNRYCLQLEQSIWAVHIALDANPLICGNSRGIKAQARKVSPKTIPAYQTTEEFP